MKISFVVPCFNAESVIEKKILKLKNWMSKLKGIKYEIILIDDGSKDNTLNILKKLKFKDIKVISNPKNLGKSISLIKGINRAIYKKIIIWDCDLPYFSCLNKIIISLKYNNFVYINRRSKKSKLQSTNLSIYQLTRLIISRIVCRIINYILIGKYIGDTQAGLKGFDKPKNFEKINFLSKKFFLDAELMILFYKSKMKMKSIHLRYRIYENSTIKIFDFTNFVYLTELFKLIFVYNIKKIKKLKI